MALYDENGEYFSNRTIVFDISKRRELEVQIQKQNDELKLANEALFNLNQEKNRFLGIASHDLQNPLTNIRLLAEKLNLTNANLTERQNYWVNDIKDTVDQMTGIIYNLLSSNRIEQGANIPIFETVDLVPILQNLLGRFHNLSERKRISLRFECAMRSLKIKTDPSYLTAIIENLLSNAIKFSPIGEQVYLRIIEKEDRVEVAISDQGLGIKPEEIPELFGKFQKLSTRPTGGESSTGLGLSIVKYHAKKINANVFCESDYGNGATFILQFLV